MSNNRTREICLRFEELDRTGNPQPTLPRGKTWLRGVWVPLLFYVKAEAIDRGVPVARPVTGEPVR